MLPQIVRCLGVSVGAVTGLTDVGSAFGNVVNVTVTNHRWYNFAGNPASCVGAQSGSTITCNDEASLSYFENNTTNAPLNTWPFPGAWVTTTGLPQLAWE